MSIILHSLQLNNKEILRGDSVSIGVFFNNLTGKNSLTKDIYDRYMASIQRMMNPILVGEMKILDENEQVILRADIGSDFLNPDSVAEKAKKMAALLSDNDELTIAQTMPDAQLVTHDLIRHQQSRVQRMSKSQLANLFTQFEPYDFNSGGQDAEYLHVHYPSNNLISTVNPALKDEYLYPHSMQYYRIKPDEEFLSVLDEIRPVYGTYPHKLGKHYNLELIMMDDGTFSLYLKYNYIIGSRFIGYVPLEVVQIFATDFAKKVAVSMGKDEMALISLPGRSANVDYSIESVLDDISNLTDETNAKLKSLLERVQVDVADHEPRIENAGDEPMHLNFNRDQKDRALENRSQFSAQSSNPIHRIIPALKAIEYVNDDATELKLFGQLPPKDYGTIKKIFEEIGGKWKRSTGTHIFEESPMDHINQIIETGEFRKKYNLGYFPTPPDLVKKVIEDADIDYFPGMTMLEPEMGQGHIADIALEMMPELKIYGYEMNPKNHAISSAKHECALGDFLQQEPTELYDLIVMNPPFEKQQDIAHVQHAMRFLKPRGQLVAIMSSSVTFRTDKKSTAFRELVEEMGGDIIENPEGAFKSSGTAVNTVTVRMRAAPKPSLKM